MESGPVARILIAAVTRKTSCYCFQPNILASFASSCCDRNLGLENSRKMSRSQEFTEPCLPRHYTRSVKEWCKVYAASPSAKLRHAWDCRNAHCFLKLELYLERESSEAPPPVDETVILTTIVHLDRCLNVHRCGERVDAKNFSTWGGSRDEKV